MLLAERLGDAEGFIELPPEELAPAVLDIVRALGEGDAYQASPDWFSSDDISRIYGREKLDDVKRAFVEAWGYLQREGLVERHPQAGFFRITRKGETIKGPEDWRRYQETKALKREVLHRKLEPYVWPPFARGAYDSAIFEAYKAVEVAVRHAGGFEPTDVGKDLMSKAFKKDGPLVDAGLPEPEQQGMQLLFMGAVALYRNATGHRYVHFSDPAEAAEVILLANHLMRIVERIAADKQLRF
jgi:uncharacterized protein (TIGR02391 family)